MTEGEGGNEPREAEPGTCAHCGLPAAATFCCAGCAMAWSFRRGEPGGDPFLARVVLSAFLATGVMVFSLALYSGFFSGGNPKEMTSDAAAALRGVYRVAALLLSLPVLHMLGVPLLEGVVRTRRWLSADSLIVLAAGAAFVVSAWSTWTGRDEVYLETATMVLVLVGLGRWLDTGTRARARADLRARVPDLLPRATLVRDGSEHDVGLETLAVGDVVRVRPGEEVPVDGLVQEGAAFVDAAAITGEQRAERRAPGDRVLAGSVALDGSLVVVAEAVAGQRLRDHVERILVRSFARRGQYAGIADRLSAWLLPGVLLLAVWTGVRWTAASDLETGLQAALAVVLIACPCALGLATPLVFWKALGEAREHGLLVKGGDVLERVARVVRVFFDKTGTLTRPDLALVGVDPGAGQDAREVLSMAAALERGSEHPVGRSIRTAYAASLPVGRPGPSVEAFRVLPGRGVEGRIGGRTYRLGPSDHARGGETVVALEGDGELLARFRLRARVQDDAAAVLAELGRRGLELGMLTGDAEGPATDIAHRLSIPVRCELAPQDKAAYIEERGAQGTLFVGDGLNDTAALAVADVGVAAHASSPRSLQVADVGLLRPGLGALPFLIDLSERAVRRARWNLAWAFAFNGVGLWLAATGRLTPVFAAAAMVASSAIVAWSSRRPIVAGPAAG